MNNKNLQITDKYHVENNPANSYLLKNILAMEVDEHDKD
jgi:hypothetical protein